MSNRKAIIVYLLVLFILSGFYISYHLGHSRGVIAGATKMFDYLYDYDRDGCYSLLR